MKKKQLDSTMQLRRDAMLKGLIRCFTGKPCIRGHVVERYVGNGDCVECSRERQRRQYHLNPGKTLCKSSAYQRANAEKISARKSAYYAANPEKMTAKVRKRDAAKIHRFPSWASSSDESAAIDKTYKQAKAMTLMTGIRHVVDHIYPLQGRTVSGLHVASNLRVITARENSIKGNKYEH